MPICDCNTNANKNYRSWFSVVNCKLEIGNSFWYSNRKLAIGNQKVCLPQFMVNDVTNKLGVVLKTHLFKDTRMICTDTLHAETEGIGDLGN